MKKLYCITCPAGCQPTIVGSGAGMIVEGNKCPKGHDFAMAEMSNPTRTLTTTVRTKFPDVPVISVRTHGEIPKDMLLKAMHQLNEVIVEEELGPGDTVLEDVAGTGVQVIITSAALLNLGAELENKNASLSGGGGTGGAATLTSEGIGSVRNSGILDDIGSDDVDGFVGAAGEAVGVENSADDEDIDEEDDGAEDDSPVKRKGRSHIGQK